MNKIQQLQTIVNCSETSHVCFVLCTVHTQQTSADDDSSADGRCMHSSKTAREVSVSNIEAYY
jgi:hypothetical protein